MPRRIARALTPLAAFAVAASTLIACGGDDKPSTGAESLQSDPQTALVEIDRTRSGIEESLKLYKSGDDKGAASKASDTYLDHFELVEGPLREADEDLMLRLESAIRTNLILSMQDGQSVTTVTQQVEDISDDLDEAKKTLMDS